MNRYFFITNSLKILASANSSSKTRPWRTQLTQLPCLSYHAQNLYADTAAEVNNHK